LNIHPISNGYSTAYLVVSNSTAMLVDASTAEIAPEVLEKLTQLEAHLKPIVLTHYHYDHVGAADTLRKATGAQVAIHRLDADALRAGGRLHLHPVRFPGHYLRPFLTRGLKTPVVPDLEFGDDENLTQHGGIGRAFWTPGHTPGSQSVLLPDGTVLAGDALTEAVPSLHTAAGPLFAEDPDRARHSIITIANTAGNHTVHVAHNGSLKPKSLTKLSTRTQKATTDTKTTST
jgi:hydroxyacylglutathione hydrolase